MRKLISIVIASAFIGCGPLPDDPTDTQSPMVSSSVGGAACDAKVVETILQGQNGGKMVALCKSCDRGCEDKGHTCNTYGESCNFFGDRGVCAACCDGEVGELRCHPIE